MLTFKELYVSVAGASLFHTEAPAHQVYKEEQAGDVVPALSPTPQLIAQHMVRLHIYYCCFLCLYLI